MSKHSTRHRTDSLHQLSQLVQKAGIRLKADSIAMPKKDSRACREEAVSPERDDVLFRRAMQDVMKTTWRHPPAPSDPASPFPTNQADSALEDQHLMESAICSPPAATLLDHPEYIEGWVGVAGKRFLPHLRSGMYSIQAQIDLHGFGRDEARETVEKFIVQMSKYRSCCVKIIHGRGINSRGDTAVLKEHLQRWLSTRRMSRHVVAYASAPIKDGGVGAVYVLLRHTHS